MPATPSVFVRIDSLWPGIEICCLQLCTWPSNTQFNRWESAESSDTVLTAFGQLFMFSKQDSLIMLHAGRNIKGLAAGSKSYLQVLDVTLVYVPNGLLTPCRNQTRQLLSAFYTQTFSIHKNQSTSWRKCERLNWGKLSSSCMQVFSCVHETCVFVHMLVGASVLFFVRFENGRSQHCIVSIPLKKACRAFSALRKQLKWCNSHVLQSKSPWKFLRKTLSTF